MLKYLMPFRIRVSLAIVLSLLGLAVLGPFMFPVPPLEDTVPARQLADPNSQFLRAAGAELHVKTYGEPGAETVYLLLHGFGASLYTWHEVVEPLSRRGFVITLDRPAFGLSERPLRDDWEENPYTAEAQIEQVLALLDALGIPEAVLVGHSSGGLLALQTALAAPERVTGLVLVGATAFQNGGSPTLLRPLLYSPQMNRLGPLLMRQFGGESGDGFLEAAWANANAIDEATRAAYRQAQRIEDWDKALWELSKASRAPDLSRQLPGLEHPSFVLTGRADPVVPPALSERLAEALPEAEFAALEDCGHIPQEECPEPFLTSLTAWLDAHGL